MAAYVPVGLHRHRSVLMHMADDGEVLGWTGLDNDPEALVAEVLKAGEAPEVAIEARDRSAVPTATRDTARCESSHPVTLSPVAASLRVDLDRHARPSGMVFDLPIG